MTALPSASRVEEILRAGAPEPLVRRTLIDYAAELDAAGMPQTAAAVMSFVARIDEAAALDGAEAARREETDVSAGLDRLFSRAA